jgi:hypothetical protein
MNPFKLAVPLLLVLACGCSQQSLPPEEQAPMPSAASSHTGELKPGEEEAAMEACIQEKHQLLENVSKLLARHQPGCRSDADCVLVDTGIPCQSNCQMAVFAPSAQGFTRSLQEFGEAACANASKRCGIEGQCPPITGARCVNSMCRPVIEGLGAPQPPPNHPPAPGVLFPNDG